MPSGLGLFKGPHLVLSYKRENQVSPTIGTMCHDWASIILTTYCSLAPTLSAGPWALGEAWGLHPVSWGNRKQYRRGRLGREIGPQLGSNPAIYRHIKETNDIFIYKIRIITLSSQDSCGLTEKALKCLFSSPSLPFLSLAHFIRTVKENRQTLELLFNNIHRR